METIAPNLRLARRVAFSSGHRYWIPSLSETENRALFGKWASPFNHGHNYALEVSVSGPMDPESGMVVNIKRIDDALDERVVTLFDGKSINDEIVHFRTHPASTENLMLFIRDELLRDPLPGGVRLEGLRLDETPLLYGELTRKGNDWKMTLTKVYEFAASHRLHVPSYSDEKNVELFGKCNNPAGHGHNYVLEVTVEGTPDPETGMMVDLLALDAKINELVVDRYDHKNFDVDVPEFQGRPTTSENVAAEIFNRLNGQLPVKLSRIRLLETARSVFEVVAPE